MGRIHLTKKLLVITLLVAVVGFDVEAHPRSQRNRLQFDALSIGKNLELLKKDIQAAHLLGEPEDRKSALFSRVLTLDRLLRNDLISDDVIRWELIQVMKTALKEPSVRELYRSRCELDAAKLFKKYETSGEVKLLIELASDFPFTDSGEKAIGKLAEHHSAKENFTLAATFLDLLSDFHGKLALPRETSRVGGSKFESTAILGQDPSKETSHYLLANRLGPHLKKHFTAVRFIS